MCHPKVELIQLFVQYWSTNIHRPNFSIVNTVINNHTHQFFRQKILGVPALHFFLTWTYQKLFWKTSVQNFFWTEKLDIMTLVKHNKEEEGSQMLDLKGLYVVLLNSIYWGLTYQGSAIKQDLSKNIHFRVLRDIQVYIPRLQKCRTTK